MSRQTLITRLVARNLPTGQPRAGCIPCFAGQSRSLCWAASKARTLCYVAAGSSRALCSSSASKG